MTHGNERREWFFAHGRAGISPCDHKHGTFAEAHLCALQRKKSHVRCMYSLLRRNGGVSVCIESEDKNGIPLKHGDLVHGHAYTHHPKFKREPIIGLYLGCAAYQGGTIWEVIVRSLNGVEHIVEYDAITKWEDTDDTRQ